MAAADVSPADAAGPGALPGGYVGIDLGVGCVIASAPFDNKDAVTVNTNDTSNRSTPSAVSFDGKLRHVGSEAEGRAMSAPKQTLQHLPLMLGSADVVKERAARLKVGFDVAEDGTLGPVTFNGEDFALRPVGPLSALIKRLASFSCSSAPTAVAVAVPEFLQDSEVAAVHDALKVAGFSESASVLRHTDAIVAAYVHNQGSKLFGEGVEERSVAFVDIGVSHGTVSVARFSRPAAPAVEEGAPAPTDSAESEPLVEFLYRKSEEALGVQVFLDAIVGHAKSRVEDKHRCTVGLAGKTGRRFTKEAENVLKQLSMLPDASFNLEAVLPEGPDGPEIDVSVPFARDQFESLAAAPLGRLRELVQEAFATIGEGHEPIDAVELVGGGSRVPAVKALVAEVGGEAAPLRYGLDGASCVAMGAATWAGGRRMVAATPFAEGAGLSEALLEEVAVRERGIEEVHAAETRRLEERNRLESYVYKVRGWLSEKNCELLKPDTMGPYLNQVELWFEDAAYAEPETTLEAYVAKLSEVTTYVETEGAAYFELLRKEKEDKEKALELAADEERKRRQELGMDNDKDERHMKKEDRLRLAAKNKEEGNDMLKAQKFDDAIRRYKKAIDHVSRPEVVSNMTPDEADEANKIKVSCHSNTTQCYLKGADVAFSDKGKDAAEPFYKKARTSCDDVLELDPDNIKALFRRSLCWEKLGELETAAKDIKKALAIQPEDADLKRSQARLEKLLTRQKEGQKKVYAKMFG